MTNACPSMVAAAVTALAAALPAQVVWQMHGGRMRATVRVGEAEAVPIGPRALTATAAGAAAVHFPADADGKPRSLEFAVSEGDHVVIGVSFAEAASTTSLQLGVDVGREQPLTAGAEVLQARTVGSVEDGDYRLSVAVPPGAEGRFALVVRDRPDTGCYAFTVDRAAQTLRLERWLGGDHRVVMSAATEVDWTEPHRLAVQCEGFGLQAFVDDAPVLRAFDGALRQGAVGVAANGPSPPVAEITLEPLAEPRASAALVQHEDGATLHAAVTVLPGHLYLLELALDRPSALVPLGANGLEPWLQQRPAAPIVMWADWRGSFGANSFGEVPNDGSFSSELRWPRLAGLRHQVALVRVLLVDAGGAGIAASVPSLRVVF